MQLKVLNMNASQYQMRISGLCFVDIYSFSVKTRKTYYRVETNHENKKTTELLQFHEMSRKIGQNPDDLLISFDEAIPLNERNDILNVYESFKKTFIQKVQKYNAKSMINDYTLLVDITNCDEIDPNEAPLSCIQCFTNFVESDITPINFMPTQISWLTLEQIISKNAQFINNVAIIQAEYKTQENYLNSLLQLYKNLDDMIKKDQEQQYIALFMNEEKRKTKMQK